MVGSKPLDSSNKIRRKSRFDDPNPGKRQGFQDSQDGSTNNQTNLSNLRQNYNLQGGMGFPNNFNNLNNNSNNNNFQNTQVFQNTNNNQGSYNTQAFQVTQGSQVPQGFQNQQKFQSPQNLQPPHTFQNVEFQNQTHLPPPGGHQQVPPYQPFHQFNPTHPPFLPPPMGHPNQPPVVSLPTPNPPFVFNQPPMAPPMNLVGFPNQSPGHLKGKEDLDSCRVGVMASILIEHKNKTKDFVPYKPLDVLQEVPNKILDEPVVHVTLVQKNLVDDFYEELDELFDQYKNEIDPNDPNFNYSRRKKYNLNKQLNQPIKIITPEDMINPIKRDYYPPEVYSNTAKETSGLGSGEDLFESYRRKRSTKYHEHYAIREAVRKDPNCIVITPSDLCYSCNKPGHFAKDCKYGLT